MNPHVKSDLPTYAAGGLTEARRREIETHLADCEACRRVLGKLRSKQARQKRKALKDAMPNRVPNLLLTRLGKQAGFDRPAERGPWLWVALLVAALVVTIFVFRHDLPFIGSPPPSGESEGVVTDTTTVAMVPSAFQVDHSSPSEVRSDQIPAQTVPAVSTPVAATPAAPQQWSGPTSGIREPREVVIRGRNAWRALWSEMGLEGSAPRINFYESIVVGAFAGERPEGSTVVLSIPREEDERVVVGYRVVTPAAAATMSYPYALTTLPRTSKTVVLSHRRDGPE